MFRQINLGLAPCLVAATLFAWGCDRPATPAGPKPSFSDGTRSCAAGARFTGGGRIDPSVAGKTTFGFHVDARDWCSSTGPINGQVQTVNHPTKTLIHSLTIDDFVSIEDPDFGRCAFFRGTARVKEGNGSWVQEPFGAVACEKDEPGSSPGLGPDRYGISLPDEDRETGVTELTGGNILAH